MKKRVVVLVLIMVLLLTIPVYATSARTINITPNITFSGTTATCTVLITGDKISDKITATMELKQGSKVIDTWSETGTLLLKVEETAEVERNKTYTLTVEYTINGVAKTPVTISRTNS